MAFVPVMDEAVEDAVATCALLGLRIVWFEMNGTWRIYTNDDYYWSVDNGASPEVWRYAISRFRELHS